MVPVLTVFPHVAISGCNVLFRGAGPSVWKGLPSLSTSFQPSGSYTGVLTSRENFVGHHRESGTDSLCSVADVPFLPAAVTRSSFGLRHSCFPMSLLQDFCLSVHLMSARHQHQLMNVQILVTCETKRAPVTVTNPFSNRTAPSRHGRAWRLPESLLLRLGELRRSTLEALAKN